MPVCCALKLLCRSEMSVAQPFYVAVADKITVAAEIFRQTGARFDDHRFARGGIHAVNSVFEYDLADADKDRLIRSVRQRNVKLTAPPELYINPESPGVREAFTIKRRLAPA